MRNLILRILINAIAIFVAAAILPGIQLADDGLGTLLLLGLIIGVINALVRPLLILLTCPAVILTLGLFILVINGVLLQLAASLSGERLLIDSFGWAILGGIIMSLTAMALEGVLGIREENNYEKQKHDSDML